MSLSTEFRHAFRKLVKSPGFTVLAVFTLALGIGLNSAVFSVVNALLFKPLPVTAPEALVNLYTEEPSAPIDMPMAYPDYQDLMAESRSFSQLAAYMMTTLILEEDGENVVVPGEVASGNFFSTLGLEPARGRFFTADEDRRGDPRFVTVVSYQTWQRRFGGEPGLVGREIRINGQPFTVLGIAPENFLSVTRGMAPEFWIPITISTRINATSGMNAGNPTPGLDRLDDRNRRWHWVLGRLAPGNSLESARAEIETFAARLEQSFPDTNEDRAFVVVPNSQVRFLPGIDKVLFASSFVIMGLVALVLLIACSNLANMLLARAITRKKEIATRLAMGATRARIVGHLLIESLAVAFLGGFFGLLLALAANGALASVLASVPRIGLELSLDFTVVAFTMLISTLTAVAFGLVPAFEATRTNLAATLHDASRGSSGGVAKRRLRSTLVVAEVALSLLLLICAGLSVRSMQNAHNIDPGFDTEGLVVGQFLPHLQGYTPEQSRDFYERLEARLGKMPAVEKAAMTSAIPLTININIESAAPEAKASLPVDEWDNIDVGSAGPGFFEAMGVPVLRGRGFSADDTTDTRRVAVVNDKLVETFWPDENPLGQRFRINGRDEPFEVVGVVRTGKYRTLGEQPIPFIYTALKQGNASSWTVVARSSGDPQLAIAAIRQASAEIDEKIAIDDLGSAEEAIATALLLPRLGAALFGMFGAIGLLLASIGLYGVISYTVSQRTQELGIRIAMGASRFDILGLVVRDGLTLTGIGVAVGLLAAAAGTRILSAVLYGISATDLVTFAGVSLFLTLVALVASLVPARRASKVDPLVALRYE